MLPNIQSKMILLVSIFLINVSIVKPEDFLSLWERSNLIANAKQMQITFLDSSSDQLEVLGSNGLVVHGVIQLHHDLSPIAEQLQNLDGNCAVKYEPEILLNLDVSSNVFIREYVHQQENEAIPGTKEVEKESPYPTNREWNDLKEKLLAGDCVPNPEQCSRRLRPLMARDSFGNMQIEASYDKNHREMLRLLSAAALGDTYNVRILSDIAETDYATRYHVFGLNALHIATTLNYLETVKYLIELNRNFNRKDFMMNMYPIHMAAKKGYAPIVDYLAGLDSGEAKQRDINGLNALHYAARFGHLDIVKFLVEQGVVGVFEETADRRTTKQVADQYNSRNSHAEIISYLEGLETVFNSIRDLPATSGAGHTDVTNRLKPFGKKAENMTDFRDAFFTAVRKNQEDKLKFLVGLLPKLDIEKQKMLNHESDSGMTLFLTAAQHGYVDIAKYLKKSGANVEATFLGLDNALHIAAENGHEAMVKYLIEELKFNINATFYDKYLAIHHAAQNGSKGVVEYLIKTYTKVDGLNLWGQTPLHLAAAKGHLDAVKSLVEKGSANISIADTKLGETPYDYAKKFGRTNVMTYLERKEKEEEAPTQGEEEREGTNIEEKK